MTRISRGIGLQTNFKSISPLSQMLVLGDLGIEGLGRVVSTLLKDRLKPLRTIGRPACNPAGPWSIPAGNPPTAQ